MWSQVLYAFGPSDNTAFQPSSMSPVTDWSLAFSLCPSLFACYCIRFRNGACLIAGRCLDPIKFIISKPTIQTLETTGRSPANVQVRVTF